MHARTGLIALALPALAAVSVPAALSASAGVAPLKLTTHHSRLIPTKGERLPLRNADATSLNWAGYAVTGSSLTGVTQSWIVPTAGFVPPGFSSTWAGIGGYSSSDLIQAGTTQDTLPVAGGQYYAWWETLPDAETPITDCTGGDSTCAVTPGDHMSVDIHQTANNVWSITMTDAGKWNWSKTGLSYASTHSSAEWIHEAPTLVVQTTLADTGTTYIGASNTYTDSSGTHPLSAGSPVSIAMGPGLVNEATPSALTGSSFNVCAWAQTCAAPAS